VIVAQRRKRWAISSRVSASLAAPAASLAVSAVPLSNGGTASNGDLLGASGSDDLKSTKDKAKGSAVPDKKEKPVVDEGPKGPTPYSLWEQKRQQILADKQAKADEAKKAIALTAKDEIAKFYNQRTERIAQNKQQNRIDEKTLKAEIATLFQFGQQWEKVGKLINIAPKANEKRTVDRMRKLLLALKNDAGAGAANTDSKKDGPAKTAAGKTLFG